MLKQKDIELSKTINLHFGEEAMWSAQRRYYDLGYNNESAVSMTEIHNQRVLVNMSKNIYDSSLLL